MSAEQAPPGRPAPAPRHCGAGWPTGWAWKSSRRPSRGGQVPGGASLWHTFGAVAAGLFVLEAVTGILLATVYTPSVTGAWASVAYIQDQLTLGWFVRGLHSFGSSALIVVAGLHLLQVLLFGAYRRPRELNWMVGLALFGVVALFALSGYLLALGPEGLLGEAGRGDDRGQRPDRRRPDAEADSGRRRVRQPDVDPRLRVPRDGVARAADRPAGAAHLPVPAPRLHAEVVAVAAGRRRARGARLAGPGGPQRRRRRAGVGRRRRRGHRAPRRAAGIAGRSDVQLPRPPRVVRAAAVPAAHVLRGAARDRGDDDHPRHRHGAGVRAAVPRSRADEPPSRSAAGAGRRRAGPGGADARWR